MEQRQSEVIVHGAVKRMRPKLMTVTCMLFGLLPILCSWNCSNLHWNACCEGHKYVGLHFHDLRRTGIRNLSRKGIPEKAGMLISGHRTNSVWRRYNVVDMEVVKEATVKIEEHQRALKPENNHRTATANGEISADDKTDPVN